MHATNLKQPWLYSMFQTILLDVRPYWKYAKKKTAKYDMLGEKKTFGLWIKHQLGT